MEVYCNKCKYYWKGDFSWGRCKAPQLGMVTDYINGNYQRTIEVDEPDYPNKRDTNGCTYYKAKGWLRRIYD